jgi:CRP-like cAMP-binding protein
MTRAPANALLRRLTPEDLERASPSFEEVTLAKGQVLLEPETPIDYVHFPLTAICSVIAVTASESPIEVGMFGNEGMSDLIVREGDRTYFRTVCFIEGQSIRMSAATFARLLTELSSLNELTMRYKDYSAVQFGYSAYAHGAFTIEARLARWILMATDRAQDVRLPVVHDLVASLLSVRRSGVTTAMHILEGLGAIKSTRGLVTVLDRNKLEEIAGDCYGPAERAYDSLIEQAIAPRC